MALPSKRTEFIGRLSTGGLQLDGIVTVTTTEKTLADLGITLSKIAHRIVVQNIGSSNITFGPTGLAAGDGFLLLPNVVWMFDRLLEGDVLNQVYWIAASDQKMAIMQMG